MKWRRDARSYFASLTFHVLVLAFLCGMRLGLVRSAPELSLESADAGDAAEETMLVEPVASAPAEIQIGDMPGDSPRGGNGDATSAGAAVAATAGAAAQKSDRPATRLRIAPVLTSATGTRFRPIIDAPGDDASLAQEVDHRAVKGEPAAPTANYGDALSRIGHELIRLMHEGPLLVVWLFDESESMRDDQAAVRANLHRVYEEIGLEITTSRSQREKAGGPSKGKGQPEPLLSAVVGFGERVHPVIKTPTGDFRTLSKAIDQLAVDRTGRENTARALAASLEEYRSRAKRQKRRLVFVVVTDESGDDWEHLEDLIVRMRDNRSPVYVLGREAVFGYPWAHMRWVDPVYGLTHWVQINRGPETAMPECLQWDGLHGRNDAFSSGAAPYELARLVSESGGIYFVLPDEEQNLSGAGANEKRRLAFLNLRQYQPDLQARDEYEQQRNASPFRSTVWSVIRTLNPHLDPQLNLREWNYPVEPAAFQQVARGEFQKALRAMVLLNQALAMLEGVRASRSAESSQRWRADYDLLCAQCRAYRVRLFQFLLAIDQHAKAAPIPKTPPNNCWNVVRRREMLPPDAEQVEQTKVNLQELNAQEKEARRLFELVVSEHAGTPWAERAKYELNTGFGMSFSEAFADPRYAEVGKTITLPKF